MRIVYTDGTHRPPPAPVRPGRETRRVPVVVIRTGEADQTTTTNGVSQDSTSVIDIAGTDYRLTLSPQAVARDRAVRGHERDHLLTLGGYAASDVSYTTRTGPGGESVAVGGRIAVDMAEIPNDPRATLQKARTIYAAATAPGDPSAADMRVAAMAYRLMQKAQNDLSAEQQPQVSLDA